MNALVKKEIRLLWPSWIVAVLLALVQGITRPYDFYVASLLFFGLTIMALTTIGREASLNTFSSMLAQPAERIRIWHIKLSVLSGAFLAVFLVWLAAFGIAFLNSNVDASDRENSYNLFITICLIATATFTGGLWTTLLLRQLAGAFWLTLLVPATLSGFSGVFLAESESGSLVIAVLSVVIGVYSIAGFFFARWLFFRAQDVGWSGGVIAMPEWKFLTSRAGNAVSARNRKPIFALIKKELQLQQVSLMGAAGLLVLHAGTIVARAVHHFDEKSSGASAGAIFVAIFWILWLVMAPVIGSMTVAEERRLGVMEGQLCQPVSRRIQFVIKAFLTLFLGIILGGVAPVVLEKIGGEVGGGQSVFSQPGNDNMGAGIVVFAAWLALVSFFASTLAKSFLQAVGFGIATFFGCVLMVPLFTNGRMLFLDAMPAPTLLPLIIAVPTIIVTLLWLAYLNFNHFRDGWPLWRRNVGGIAGALLFIFVSSNVLYHRAWEVFEPADPAHGSATMSLAQPPEMHLDRFDNLQVRLPDGRVWFGSLNRSPQNHFREILGWLLDPLPKFSGPQQFIAGADWASAAVRHIDQWVEGTKHAEPSSRHRVLGCFETVAIKTDGTLWLSDKTAGQSPGTMLTRFGNESNWQAVQWSHPATTVLLLKKDGTLWRWGASRESWAKGLENCTPLNSLQPHQIGTDADWKTLSPVNTFAQKSDGSIWTIWPEPESGVDKAVLVTNLNHVNLDKFASSWYSESGTFIGGDGTLWAYSDLESKYNSFKQFQCSKDTNWLAATASWNAIFGLKTDGSLWLCGSRRNSLNQFAAPRRLGVHDDWVAISGDSGGVVALSADGSLWFWMDRSFYEYQQGLLQLPKQPRFLGNVFSAEK